MPYRKYGTEAIILQEMANINQRFADNLRKIRKQKGLSQQKLAEKAHIDLTTVSELENGEREPMLRTIVNLARALEVSAKDLMPF